MEMGSDCADMKRKSPYLQDAYSVDLRRSRRRTWEWEISVQSLIRIQKVKGEVVLILREGKMIRDLQSFVFSDLKLSGECL